MTGFPPAPPPAEQQVTIGVAVAPMIDAMLGQQPQPLPVSARLIPMANGMFKLVLVNWGTATFSDWNATDLRSLYDMLGQALGIEPAPKLQVARPEDAAMLAKVIGQHDR